MPMLEQKTGVERRSGPLDAGLQEKQRRQMLIALGLLLAALIVVVVKDRDFWFPSSTQIADDSSDQPAPSETAPDQLVTKGAAPATRPARAKQHTEHAAPAHSIVASTVAPVPGPSITATNRAALPPLEVEVVAGGQHTVLQPPNPSVKVDINSGAPALPVPGALAMPTNPAALAAPSNVATNAGERVRLSADTTQAVERPVEPSYPMLAKQMRVQGSVVLQALIGREGGIQDLRVLSGPAILSTAAMDAVRQWRFRPYYQSGQAIETEARITVNFTISTN